MSTLFTKNPNIKTDGIGVAFIALVLALTFLCLSMASCYHGCAGTKGMVGYGDDHYKGHKHNWRKASLSH